MIPHKSEGGRVRRGKTGGTVERPVCIETGEMDHEDSVGPWPTFPRIKRETTTRPRQLARADRKTGVCRGQILWRGEWDSAAPVGLVLGLHGGEMIRERDFLPDSERVRWRRPSGPRRYSELFWGAWSETQQKLHLQDNIFLFVDGTICSSCNAWSFFVYIYVLHTKFTVYATFYLSERCLWINLVHSMNITDFTTNPTTTDSTRVFPKVTTESHSLRRGSSSFHCLPSGLFSPLQLYTC